MTATFKQPIPKPKHTSGYFVPWFCALLGRSRSERKEEWGQTNKNLYQGLPCINKGSKTYLFVAIFVYAGNQPAYLSHTWSLLRLGEALQDHFEDYSRHLSDKVPQFCLESWVGRSYMYSFVWLSGESFCPLVLIQDTPGALSPAIFILDPCAS